MSYFRKCAFCEFFIDKHRVSSINSRGTPYISPNGHNLNYNRKTLTQKMIKELINKFEKENKYKEKIKKLVKKEHKDKKEREKDDFHISYRDFGYHAFWRDPILENLNIDESLEKFISNVKELQESYMTSEFERMVKNVLTRIITFERNIIHLDDVREQKGQIPIYVKSFLDFAKEHDIIKFKKTQLQYFCTISGITIHKELLSAFNILAESQLKRQKKDELGIREYVYFAGEKNPKEIKIGYSKNPEKRILSLNTGNPHKLELIKKIPGDLEKEAGIHELFEDLKVNKNKKDEWFKYTDELKEFVKNIN